MNILVVGNGFDLAHGLPTKYKDFLDFIEVMKILVSNNDINKKNQKINEISKEKYNKHVISFLKDEIKCANEDYSKFQKKKHIIKLSECIENNVWIYYFTYAKIIKDDWIDFESEISSVIQSIDYMRKYREKKEQSGERYCNKIYEAKENRMLKILQSQKIVLDNLTDNEHYDLLISILIDDLNKLTMALEIYLFYYIRNINIKELSVDIKELDIDGLLSFNYTDTYSRIYVKNKNIKENYIHGIATDNYDNTIGRNNMVLGIDEYLNDSKKDEEIEFIKFKKYYQRIYKKTGASYQSWIKEISENLDKDNSIYFFGHSLNITDGDIIRDLLLGRCLDNNEDYKKKIKIFIYYHNDEDYSRKIINLTRVIGQDELIRMVSGTEPIITFIQQKKSSNYKFVKEVEEAFLDELEKRRNDSSKNYMGAYFEHNKIFIGQTLFEFSIQEDSTENKKDTIYSLVIKVKPIFLFNESGPAIEQFGQQYIYCNKNDKGNNTYYIRSESKNIIVRVKEIDDLDRFYYILCENNKCIIKNNKNNIINHNYSIREAIKHIVGVTVDMFK